jgi:hypothetical protein
VAEIPVDWTMVPGSKVHVALDSWRMLLDVARVGRASRSRHATPRS